MYDDNDDSNDGDVDGDTIRLLHYEWTDNEPTMLQTKFGRRMRYKLPPQLCNYYYYYYLCRAYNNVQLL